MEKDTFINHVFCRLCNFCFLLGYVIFLCSCASQFQVPIDYSGVEEIERMPDSISRRHIIVSMFEDRREEPKVVGMSGNDRMITEGDVPELVTSAVVDALRKSGLDAKKKESGDVTFGKQIILEGRLHKFMSTIERGWSHMHTKGEVMLQYRLLNSRGIIKDWSKPITGTNTRDIKSTVYYIEVRDFNDAALQDCVKELVKELKASRALETN